MKNKTFFSGGLFDKPIMSSKIKTASMTVMEKILGYLLGPFGILAFVAVVNQLTELYYTEIFYIDQIFGAGSYLLMTWVTKAIGIVAGLFIAYVVEHTDSKAGRVRPLILIGCLLSAVSGFFMFFIPEMPNVLKLIWIYVFNILFNGFGAQLLALRTHLFTLCTRSQNDRNVVNLFEKMSGFLLVGTAVTMTVGSVLYYTMLHNHPAENWIMLIGAFAAFSIPLSFIHYYYTMERVTLESGSAKAENETKVPLLRQVGGLFTSKYWIMATALTVTMTIANNLAGYNLNTNFCTIILGATAENNYNLFYTIASGVPMGLGILIVYPLCKKYTIRKTTIAFSVVAILGSIIGYIAKTNFVGAIAGNFIFNMGTLPVIYILGALINAANDEVEYKHGFRPEGTLSAAIIMCILNLFTGIFAGVYETGLNMNGYDPLADMAQPVGVVNWIYFIKYAVPAIEYGIIILILFFMNLESKLPVMQKAIRARYKAAAEARGEIWISPEELEEREKEENARLAEEARISDLKAKCAKRGLDFDTENRKYLDKIAKKANKK
jgi:GPH family glycoside/pentoside/hexuronide:cation symporter